MFGIKKTLQFGEHKLVIETGIIARQATGSVLVSLNDTTVLVTVVGHTEKCQADFFPLRVDYLERTYAAGKIPGGFFKREGRPSERETLISRLIDRPIRPLFPKGFKQDVQVIATVMSLDPEVEPDIAALIGASAALAISGIPFDGPMGAARVGYQDGQYLLNPSQSTLKDSDLNLVVAGTDTSVLMVESEASGLDEDVMLGAVMFGHQHYQAVIELIKTLASEVGKPRWDWTAPQQNDALKADIRKAFGAELEAAYELSDKQLRRTEVLRIEHLITERFLTEELDIAVLKVALERLERDLVRGRILKGERRIDGRDTTQVRPIHIQTGLLPRVHGSSLFTRGETQAMVSVTLGTSRDAQLIDSPMGEYKDTFMLHYNFPPYSVGDIGQVGSPKRREIGHGKLAKRALQAVLPPEGRFPYVLRVVSEITESNGSSSMASVCGASLALMDAGVPLKSAVAGIAMGLIKEGDHYAVLTDILGDEDHLGDMDFKVAGTKEGVTALQMDIKIQGITEDIMKAALEQAKSGRLHILDIMNVSIDAHRQQMSDFAPRIISFKIPPDKIREVIGKGGATIKALTEETGATVEINDDGQVQVISVDREAGEEAKRRIEMITQDAEVGKIYEGKVVRLAEYGAFVNIFPGKDGLVHVSQISFERVENVEDELSEGQVVRVKVLEIDRQGRIRLSIKAVLEEEHAENN